MEGGTVPEGARPAGEPPAELCFVPWCGETADPHGYGACAMHRRIELNAHRSVQERSSRGAA